MRGCRMRCSGSVSLCRSGYGHAETAARQPAPRVFRLDADGALINRLGFNSGGLDALANACRRGLLGVASSASTSAATATARCDRRLCRGGAAGRGARRLSRRQRLVTEYPRSARLAGRNRPRGAARSADRDARGRPGGKCLAAAASDCPRSRRRGACGHRRSGPSPQASSGVIVSNTTVARRQPAQPRSTRSRRSQRPAASSRRRPRCCATSTG